MTLKSHPFHRFALIIFLAAALSACQLVLPTPLSQATGAPTAAATLPPEPSATLPPADGATALPVPSIEPTEDPSASLVDLSTVNAFYSLVMPDAFTGWAVTNLGLLHTTDGGITWHLTNPPQFDTTSNPLGSFFPDAASAYLLSPGEDFVSGTLYHTTDSGRSWSSTHVPFAMGSIQFIDAQKGFVMASLGAGAGSNAVAIYESNDGGLTWQKLFSTLDQETPSQDSLGNGGIKSGATFLDAQRGWITGSIPMESFIYLYATTDGGLTWHLQSVPLPDGAATSFYSTEPPVFFNATDGLLQAQQSPSDSSPVKKALFATHDGGATWQPLPSIEGSGPLSTPTATDWFFWNQGKLMVTHDAGATWQDVPTSLQLSESPGLLVFANPMTGWELHYSADSAIHFYTTTNGGQAWEPIIP